MPWFDGYHHMGWTGGWWMILFWLGVAVLIIWGLRVLFFETPRERRSNEPLSALEIARQRYARGELSRDEYLALVEDLQIADRIYPKAKRSE